MKKIHIRLIGCLLIISCFIYFGYYQYKLNNIDNEYIGAYLDGEYVESIPIKGEALFKRVECDNGATGTWNNDVWGLLTTNMTKRTKCNLYFQTIVGKIKSSVDTTGKCPTVNADGSIRVNGVETGEGYLCSAPDAYGTSYYYRGNVTNNYVYFAGYYWRIVRINGDGSIRIIYDGTVAHTNGEASGDRQYGVSIFNTNYNDNAYVGYMYGMPGSTSYEETHANINSSALKKYLDKFHEEHIKTDYSSYLGDNVFCNDRSIVKKGGYENNFGYGVDGTSYRWYYSPWDEETYRNNVSLICPQKNDAFTTDDITYGNGALTYPIGLITMDEVVLAGGWNGTNSSYYLYTGDLYWTFSPHDFNGTRGVNRVIYSDGNAGNSFYYVHNNVGVRPVYNLKANSLVVGDGTMENPYRLTKS